ncbi:hypothetical protein [Streptomyces sp. NPDC058603]|uniref:hypothetical protein n=1 Tax=Streptomyces sp. NPDC058603 TaxID=3346551 RepID=UPI00364E4896
MDVYTALRITDGLSSRMLDALHFYAKTNPQGSIARTNLGNGGGTHGALYRRGMVDLGINEHGLVGYFLTPKAWAYLRHMNGTVRPADAGRLNLNDALAAAYPAEQPVADDDQAEDDNRAEQQPAIARNAFEQAAEGLLDAPQAGTVHLYVCEAPSYLCARGRCTVSSTRAIGNLDDIRTSAAGFRHAWAVDDQGHHTAITPPVLPDALRATRGDACGQDPKRAHSLHRVTHAVEQAVEQFETVTRAVDAVEHAEQVEADVDTVVEAEALHAAHLVTEAEATAGTWRGAWIGRTDPGATLFDLDLAGQGALFA